MKRIAILHSGLLRRPIHKYIDFRNFKLGPHNVESFMHAWFDESNRSLNSPNPNRINEKNWIGEKSLVKFLYRPRNFVTENPEAFSIEDFELNDFTLENIYSWGLTEIEDRNIFRAHQLSNNLSMWCSIKRCYDEFVVHENSSRIEHDFLVRARYDVLPKLNISQILEHPGIDKGIIVPLTDHPKNEINDWFAIGAPEKMRSYFSIYDSIEDIIKKVVSKYGYWSNEAGLKYHLENQGIEIFEQDMGMKF